MTMQLVKTGTVTGTGAALNVSLGWVPDYVRIVNVTDGDRIDEWFSDMTAGTAVTTTTAAATTASNGISAYAGTAAGLAPGFTIGSTISENAKVLSYVAIRNR
jgi:hypothetical protein